MPRRIALLSVVCLLEAVVVALLAWQVFAGSGSTSAPESRQPGAAARPSENGGDEPAPRVEESTPRQTPTTGVPARQAVAPTWNAEDPIGVLLTGSLRLRDGSPAAASIAVTLDDARRFTSAAEDGSYALIGLRPGEWQVTVQGQTVVEHKETVTLTDEAVQFRDFTVDASFPVRVMIVTPGGEDATRAVRLTMHGWSDFSVVGQRARFPDRFAATDYGRIWAGDARWSPEMNPVEGFAGTLYLTSLPAHVALLQRHLVLEQQVVQPGQEELKFTVDVEELQKLAASATVRVLDAVSGEPLTGARVSLTTSNRIGPGTPVDEQGRALVTGLTPGLLQCSVSAPEHEGYHHVVRVEPGQRLDLGDIRLGPTDPLTGTVLGPGGEPAAARLQWTELKWRTSPAEFRYNRSATTEADGKFQLWGSGRGTIAVRAIGGDGLMAAGVFDNPPASPVVLLLAPPGECEVTRPPDPTRAFTLTFYDAGKRAIAAFAIEPRQTELTVKLPFGDYTFDVHELGRLVHSGSLHFGENPCTVEIR